jgi:hypothetical protein
LLSLRCSITVAAALALDSHVHLGAEQERQGGDVEPGKDDEEGADDAEGIRISPEMREIEGESQ